MPIEEIEKRLEWLTNAAAAYRTLLVVRQLQENKPKGFVVDFEEPEPEEPIGGYEFGKPPIVNQRLEQGWLKPKIIECLTKYPRLGKHQIAEKLHVNATAVYAVLQQQNREGSFVKIKHDCWIYSTDPEVQQRYKEGYDGIDFNTATGY